MTVEKLEHSIDGVLGRGRTAIQQSKLGRDVTRVLGLISLFGGVTLVAWLRLPIVARNTVWAEDGRVFLGDNLSMGTLPSLLDPLGGYLHFLPRVLTAIAVYVATPERYAVTVAALCCAVIGTVGALVYVLSADIIKHRTLRVVLAFIPAIVPMGPIEIAGNMANLHWYLLFLAPWLFMAQPRTWPRSIALALTTLAVGLTEIQAVVFVPLLLLGLKLPKRYPIIAAAGVSAVAQIACMVSDPRVRPPAERGNFVDLVVGIVLQPVSGSATTNTWAVSRYVFTHNAAPLLAALSLFLALAVFSAIRATTRQRVALLAAAWGSVVVYCAGVLLNPQVIFLFHDYTKQHYRQVAPNRYGAAGSMFFLTSAVLVAAYLYERRSRLLRAVAVCLIGFVTLSAVVNFSVPFTRRDNGPAWDRQVREAKKLCDDPIVLTVPLRAAPAPTLWTLNAPCSYVATR